MHVGDLTRQGLGHAGIILFRRSVPAVATNWDWSDRIEYLPQT